MLRPKSNLALLVVVVTALATTTATAHEGRLTFAPVLEDVTPAVVSIRTLGPQARNPLYNDPFFRRFSRTATRPGRPWAPGPA